MTTETARMFFERALAAEAEVKRLQEYIDSMPYPDEYERQTALMREAACRLKPLTRRAITEGGQAGDQARRDLHEAIDWLARGCPQEATADA
jgi:hypothetical protein